MAERSCDAVVSFIIKTSQERELRLEDLYIICGFPFLAGRLPALKNGNFNLLAAFIGLRRGRGRTPPPSTIRLGKTLTVYLHSSSAAAAAAAVRIRSEISDFRQNARL